MRIYCINREDRKDRRDSILAQDFGFPVLFYPAVMARRNKKLEIAAACTQSHVHVIRYHQKLHGDAPCLILEDDAAIYDAVALRDMLAAPPAGWTNLGPQRIEKFPWFHRTHAMLYGGGTPLRITESYRSTRMTEEMYALSGPVRLVPSTVVDFKPFVSDRTKESQTPIELSTAL